MSRRNRGASMLKAQGQQTLADPAARRSVVEQVLVTATAALIRELHSAAPIWRSASSTAKRRRQCCNEQTHCRRCDRLGGKPGRQPTKVKPDPQPSAAVGQINASSPRQRYEIEIPEPDSRPMTSPIERKLPKWTSLQAEARNASGQRDAEHWRSPRTYGRGSYYWATTRKARAISSDHKAPLTNFYATRI
jgi:hypothetical protein